jgi:hypothetical protein
MISNNSTTIYISPSERGGVCATPNFKIRIKNNTPGGVFPENHGLKYWNELNSMETLFFMSKYLNSNYRKYLNRGEDASPEE